MNCFFQWYNYNALPFYLTKFISGGHSISCKKSQEHSKVNLSEDSFFLMTHFINLDCQIMTLKRVELGTPFVFFSSFVYTMLREWNCLVSSKVICYLVSVLIKSTERQIGYLLESQLLSHLPRMSHVAGKHTQQPPVVVQISNSCQLLPWGTSNDTKYREVSHLTMNCSAQGNH